MTLCTNCGHAAHRKVCGSWIPDPGGESADRCTCGLPPLAPEDDSDPWG